MSKVGRNSPCPCGSGRKYKQCCLNSRGGFSGAQKMMILGLVLLFAAGAVGAVWSFKNHESSGRVWSEEHQHWHPAP